jgi:hypothetical protein
VKIKLTICQHPVTGKWNARRPEGKHPYRFKWLDTKEEVEAAIAKLEEEYRKIAQRAKRKKNKAKTSIQYIVTGAKRRRAGGHGYSGGDGYVEM